MSTRKTIAVIGATGAQGGGLVRAILADPEGGFAVRAITRDTASDKARELAALGAEVVAADIDDEAALTRALTGCHGAFFVTFFWAHFSPDKEKQNVATFARAAKAAGIRHAIWSTLEDTRKWVPLTDNRMPTLMEHYKVPHFDAKGESNARFTEASVPTTFLYTSFYWDNFIYFGMGPKKGPDGRYAITLPMADAPMPGIASEDIGRCAYGIFKKGGETIGQEIGIAGEHPTGKEMAAAMGRALGIDVHYNAVTPAAYRSFGFPGAEDLGNMFQFYQEFAADFGAKRSVAASKALNPALQSLDQWLAVNAKRIPLE
ncbi:MAG: NmrA/HSCARG family protein [Betaproteobacteria bacterium]|nr:NmrA/HSCARG family protein [Betaproteobacteria bacterium]